MEDLDRILKRLGNPCHVLPNVIVLLTALSAEEVFHQLEVLHDSEADRYLVAPLSSAWHAKNLIKAGKCFEDELRVGGYSPGSTDHISTEGSGKARIQDFQTLEEMLTDTTLQVQNKNRKVLTSEK
jgi:hypothetical protein